MGPFPSQFSSHCFQKGCNSGMALHHLIAAGPWERRLARVCLQGCAWWTLMHRDSSICRWDNALLSRKQLCCCPVTAKGEILSCSPSPEPVHTQRWRCDQNIPEAFPSDLSFSHPVQQLLNTGASPIANVNSGSFNFSKFSTEAAQCDSTCAILLPWLWPHTLHKTLWYCFYKLTPFSSQRHWPWFAVIVVQGRVKTRPRICLV